MNDNTTIREMIRKLAGFEDLLYESAVCRVSDIDTSKNTCTCTPIDGSAEFTGVQLSMDKSKGFLLIPKNGSLVVVTQLNDFDGFVSMVSDVDQIYLRGDGEGGLVKLNDLVSKLNVIENDINTLKTAFSTWVTVPSDGGAALKAITTTWFGSSITPTVASDLENDKIKQE